MTLQLSQIRIENIKKVSIISLSVLIIAYNEEELIERTILETLNYLKKLKIDYEIIVCCNGCTDKTVKIVKNLCKFIKFKLPSPLNYISTKQKGVGIAIRKGIKASTKEYITFIAGDGESDLSFIKRAWKLKDKYDYILGSRYLRKQTRGASSLRGFLSKGFVFMTKILFSNKFSEVGVMRMFRTEWAKKLHLESLREDIQIELNYWALKDELKTKEIPIKNIIRRPASESKANLIRDTFMFFKSIFIYGLNLRAGYLLEAGKLCIICFMGFMLGLGKDWWILILIIIPLILLLAKKEE